MPALLKSEAFLHEEGAVVPVRRARAGKKPVTERLDHALSVKLSRGRCRRLERSQREPGGSPDLESLNKEGVFARRRWPGS